MDFVTFAPTSSVLETPAIDTDIDLQDLTLPFFIKITTVFLAGTLASAAGVGGGAVYTVLYIILFGLVYEAIPLSKVAVFFASVAYFVANLCQPAPTTIKANKGNRFAYDVVIIMEPATLLGTTYGVLASKVTPYWIITGLMSTLLTYSAYKTFKKAKSIEDKETRDAEPGLLESPPTEHAYGAVERNILKTDEEEEDKPGGVDVRLRCAVTILLCFAALLATSLLDTKHIVRCGSPLFYVTILASTLFTALVTIINIRALSSAESAARTIDAPYKYASFCFAAGFLSSLCGVGGSTIKGPILLHLGIDPVLARNTSQLMLLSTVGASAIQFYLVGTVPVDYAVAFGMTAVLATVVGKTVVDGYIVRRGKKSVIVWLLGIYIVLSAVLMTAVGMVVILRGTKRDMSFRGICEAMPPDLSALRIFS